MFKNIFKKIQEKIIPLIEKVHLKIFGYLRIIKYKTLIWTGIVFFVSFSYGFLCYSQHVFPFDLINKIYISILNKKQKIDYKSKSCKNFEKIDDSFINISGDQDVIKKRNDLIKFIWKNNSFPNDKQPFVIKNIKDDRYNNKKITNLKRIDKLVVKMDYGFISNIYYFNPEKSNGKLIIYHQGHRGDFFNGYKIIKEMIQNGYTVIAISMPLLGMNNQPEIKLKRFGKIKFESHDQFKLLDNKNFSSLKLFIEPVIVAINYAYRKGFKDIEMVGISGGGWTTLLSAAIDPRIKYSYSIAGSYPFYLRSKKYGENFGDYEQSNIDLYRIANYLELYLMASFGDHRRHTQIINIYDSCCFSGYKYLSYKDVLYDKIKDFDHKADFKIYTDDTHFEHKISKNTLKYILQDLNKL